MVVTWPITKNGQTWKVVALHCIFLNLVELYSEVLLLLRYDVKDFEKHHVFFFVFCIFLHENQTKQNDFTTFRKLKERTIIIVLWEIWPKKEGACPKKGNLPLTDYKRPQKVRHGLQSLLIDYKKRLQKLDLDYKVWW